MPPPRGKTALHSHTILLAYFVARRGLERFLLDNVNE
jgi:hypothetical protein